MFKLTYLKNGNKIIPDIILFLIYLLNLFTVNIFDFNSIIALIVLFLIVLIWNNDNFYLVLPILIFFSSILILPFNIKVFDIYSLMFIVKLILAGKLHFKKKFIIPLIILLVFSISVGFSNSIRISIVMILSSVFIMLYISNYLVNDCNITKFLEKFVFASILASIFGMINLSNLSSNFILVNGLVTSITRNIGPFTDPNYFGFFINISIFIIITLKLHIKKQNRLFLIIFLYFTLVSTISLTAILCNIIGVFLISLIYKKNKIKFIVISSLVILIFFVLWDYILSSNVPILSDFILRIQSLNLNKDINLDLLTTTRSIIWSNHWNYFINQPIINILFGGNFITDYGFSNTFKSVSHQVHLDMLLNFGFVGTSILNGWFLFQNYRLVSNFIKTRNNNLITIMFIKYTWLFYSFGLSMFPAWIFNIFFFL